MQTGAGTVMNTLAVQEGASIAVFGTGSVGLAAVMAARIVGANPIIGVDINRWRLEIARELGATHVINATHEDIASVISSITGGGVDYVLEITGNPAMLQLAFDVLNPDGTVALFAGERDPDSMPENKKTVSVTEGSSIPQIFIPKLIELYQAKLFPFDRIVKFYDFTEINRAIEDVRRGDTIKPVLRISENQLTEIS
jgi:aryl-alcohol dehydrogenase